jgi:hypothetical protein
VAKTETAPAAPILDPAIEKLGKMIETVAGSVAKQQTRLDQILQAQPSNTVPVEKKDPAARNPNEVSWPHDMNRDLSRGAVEKEVSFYPE